MTRPAVVLLTAAAALVFPGIASAGQQTPVTIYNNLDTAVRFHYESNHCWNVDNWDGDPEVASGDSLTIDSGVQDDSSPCDLDSNYTLTFEPEIETGSQWINPYDSSFSNPYNTSSSWELHMANNGSDVSSTVELHDTPGDQAWLPLTAINSITPDGTGDTGLGVICVDAVDGKSGNPGTPLKMYLENEQACEDASSSASSASTSSDAPVGQAPAAKGSSGDQFAIYDLTEMLSGACSLLFPDNSDCSDIDNDDNWSFPTGDDAIPADVENLESEATISPTLEIQYVAAQEQDNTGDTDGSMSFDQEYTYGTQQASATTQGYELSNSTSLNFGSVFTIAQGSDTFTWTGDWSTTDTQTTSDTNSTSYTNTVDTLPNGTTTAILWQGYGSATYNYTADLAFGGQSGTAYPFGTPDTRVLGTSPAQTHPCIGYLIGDESVIDSGMYLADVASSKDYYAGDPNVTNAAEQSFLSGMDSWGSSDDVCPGFPDGFSSGASFDGSGSLTTNTVQGSTDDAPDWMITADGTNVANILELCTYFDDAPSSDYSPSVDDPCETADTSSSSNGASRGDSAPVPGTTIDAADFPHRKSFKGTSFSNLMRADDTPDFDVMHARSGVFDVMRGGPYRELLDGGKGRDSIRGFARADVLKGGPGFDTVLGGKGADTLSDPRGIGGLEGNAGADELIAGAASRAGLHGGNGRDVLIAKGGDSALYGGAGDDHYRLSSAGEHAAVIEFPGKGFDSVSTNRSLSVGSHVEKVRGRGGRNLALSSGAADQHLFGSSGDDRLAGGDGADVMAGGPGDDRLLLDPFGLDVARGNQGADRFIPQGDPVRFSSNGDNRCKPNSMRRLVGFKQRRGDRIVLRNSVYGGLPAHRRGLHVVNARHPKAHQPGATVLFDTDGSCLRFDRGGTGPYATKPIAALPGVSLVRKRAFAVRSN